MLHSRRLKTEKKTTKKYWKPFILSLKGCSTVQFSLYLLSSSSVLYASDKPHKNYIHKIHSCIDEKPSKKGLVEINFKSWNNFELCAWAFSMTPFLFPTTHAPLTRPILDASSLPRKGDKVRILEILW